jgi:hypothetical protein
MPVPPAAIDPRWRLPLKVAVLLGPPDGSKPTISDRCDYLIPISASVGIGGHALDSITFSYDLDRYGKRLQDTTTPSGFSRTVEVRVENPINGKLDRVIAWGRLARQPQAIGANETVSFIARLEHFLFGERLTGYPIHDPATGGWVTVRQAIIANPVIDETRLPNRSDKVPVNTDQGDWNAKTNSPTLVSGGAGSALGDWYTVTEPGSTELDGLKNWTKGERLSFNGVRWVKGRPGPALLFIDPESMRTAPAKLLQAAIASRWDLATLVERICWTCNGSEQWIKNPPFAELQAVLGSGTSLLEHHGIPLGLSLPEALDNLLSPYGFSWFVRHSVDVADPDLPVTSTVTVIERGFGLPIDLKLQRLADPIDSAKTNIDSVSLAYDVAERPNVVHGLSKLAMREGTFTLFASWPREFDTLDISDLKEEKKTDEHPHADVFRKFVLNEAGDYTGTRPEITAATSLADLFGVPTVPMRRRLRPALTLGKDRKVATKSLLGENGYLLEWFKDDRDGWVKYPHSFGVLEHEGGIRVELNQDLIDAFLLRQRIGNAPLPVFRITCCIEGDALVDYITPRREASANAAEIVRVFNLEHKFHDNKVTNTGATASVVFDDHHASITAANAGAAGAGAIFVGIDLTDELQVGDRLVIHGSSDNDGIYHVGATPFIFGGMTQIPLLEALATSTGDGELAWQTDEEFPFPAMKEYCDKIQADEDFVVIHANAGLFGMDHPEYVIGVIVPAVSHRNLSLNSYALSTVTQRHPQITRLDFRFNPEQAVAITLEQYDRVTDRAEVRRLKK